MGEIRAYKRTSLISPNNFFYRFHMGEIRAYRRTSLISPENLSFQKKRNSKKQNAEEKGKGKGKGKRKDREGKGKERKVKAKKVQEGLHHVMGSSQRL